MEYRFDDRALTAQVFLSLVNQVWPGDYDRDKTQAALEKTIQVTAYDGPVLVGCLRILTDGCFFGTITELLVLPHQKRGHDKSAEYPPRKTNIKRSQIIRYWKEAGRFTRIFLGFCSPGRTGSKNFAIKGSTMAAGTKPSRNSRAM